MGSGTSIEQAITITRPRGRVVLVGMPGELKADLAAAWLRELEIKAAYGYEHDFPRALEFARTLKPGRHAWVQIARGSGTLNGVALKAGDGAAVSDESTLVLSADEPVEALLFDLA